MKQTKQLVTFPLRVPCEFIYKGTTFLGTIDIHKSEIEIPGVAIYRVAVAHQPYEKDEERI